MTSEAEMPTTRTLNLDFADLSDAAYFGETPWHTAARRGNIAAIDLLSGASNGAMIRSFRVRVEMAFVCVCRYSHVTLAMTPMLC